MISFLVFALAAELPADALYIGIIDDIWPGSSIRGASELHGRCLTTTFLKDADGWKAAWSGVADAFGQGKLRADDDAPDGPLAYQRLRLGQTLAPAVEWTIGFDGRKVGEYESAAFTGPICNDQFPVPAKQRAAEYLGWTGGSGQKPRAAYRPNIAVSRPNIADPDRWKPTTLTTQQTEHLLSVWRKDRQHMLWCPNDKEAAVPFDPKNAKPTVRKSYASRGSALMAFIEPGMSSGCDGSPGDEWAWALYYWADSKKLPRLVGTSLYPVDAGDYDGDGRSEWVLFASSYDKDGYVLFYDEFKHSVVSFWTYH